MKNLNEDVKMMDTPRYIALDLEYNQPSGGHYPSGRAIGSASQNQREFTHANGLGAGCTNDGCVVQKYKKVANSSIRIRVIIW
jgi:hypothetical protein